MFANDKVIENIIYVVIPFLFISRHEGSPNAFNKKTQKRECTIAWQSNTLFEANCRFNFISTCFNKWKLNL